MGRLNRVAAAVAFAAAVATATTPTAASAGSDAGGAAGASASAVPPARAVVATYNIHAGAGSDNVYDLDRTAAAIRALDADVVGLEEADVHWGDRSRWEDTVSGLGRRLGMQAVFAPIYSLDPATPDAHRREFGVALLSRHPVVAVENHDLTRLSTQDPNPVPAPAPGFLEATVQIGVAILDEDPAGANQVLLGDLNADASAPELAGLWTRLRDAWAVAPAHDGEPGLSYPAIDPTKRIDLVATSPGIDVVHATTAHDPALVGASDHRAVAATVLLDQGSESSR